METLAETGLQREEEAVVLELFVTAETAFTFWQSPEDPTAPPGGFLH